MARQGEMAVSEESLAKTALALGDTWPRLAKHLGFSEDECIGIRMVCRTEYRKELAQYMLRTWKVRYQGADMTGFLIGALKKSGRYDLLGLHGAEALQDTELKCLAEAIGHSWWTLAAHLHIDEAQIESIEGSFDKVDEQARRMLEVWREEFPDHHGMIGQLAKALREMGQYELLKMLGMEIVDEQTLDHLAEKLEGVWPKVAKHLGYDETDCESIRITYPEGGKQQALHLLQAERWRSAGLLNTDKLKGALKKSDRYDLMKFLGEEILETTTIRKVARDLDDSWPDLALYLLMDEIQCEEIKNYHREPRQQAEEMLVLWREGFEGAHPVEHLGRALIMMGKEDLAQELVSSQELQPCGRCGNSDPFKMRRYFSKDYEGFTRLIGLCCALCGQEWLSERFLFHPDVDNTRPRVKLGQVVLKEQLEVPVEKNPVFQVKDCRTKIEYFHNLGQYLKRGDHITWHRPWGIWHHAIIIDIVDNDGIVKVMHWSKRNCQFTAEIMEEELDLRQQWGETYRIDYPKEIESANTAELVIARAESRKGNIGYDLFGDNCEAFASYCKTGMAESCQLTWLWNKYTEIIDKALADLMGGALKVGSSLVKKIVQDAIAGGGAKAAGAKVGGAEILERIAKGSNWIGVGFVFAFEGKACCWDLTKMYDKRKSGSISKNDFIQTASRRVSEALFGAGLASGFGIGGQATGAFCGNFILPGIGAVVGGFLGSIIGGTLGMVIGNPLGSLVGPQIGRGIAWTMGTDDRAVARIEDLNPGDQIVIYGNLLHPRHHAIVVDRFLATGKIQVVNNTYKKGVVEELVDFTPPVYRLVYDEQKCYPPKEVIQRARSKMDDKTYRYSLVWNNCKDFARWCKMK